MVNRIAMTVAGGALFLSALPALADYVTGLDPQGDNFLALRSGPGSNYQMLRKLPPDTVLTVLESHGSWRRVELQDGAAGWAFGKYIAEGLPPGYREDGDYAVPDWVGLTGQTGAIGRNGASLLDRPDAAARLVARLQAGGGVIVLSDAADWLRVLTAAGQTGYLPAASVDIGAWPSAAPAAAAGSGKKSAAGSADAGWTWTAYVNPRFGTRIEYPESYFRADPPPANGDGLGFQSTDGRVNFLVFGQYNVFDRTLDDLRAADMASDRYDSVTYQSNGPDWYVLSGYIGPFVYYRKVLLREGGGVIHAFEVIYPETDKARMDPMVARMSRSFDAP